MKRQTKNISTITVLSILVACGKQPTELQKAQIEEQLISCLTAVTTQIGAEDTNDIFSGLSSLSSKLGSGDISKINWKIVNNNPETVNMSVKAADTKYSCDYVQKIDSPKYQLIEARRNNQVVFNLENDKKAKIENERLQEEKRIEEIKKWTERSYSNVSYKYYEKRHIADKENNYSSPKLKIECNPKRMEFELDRFSIGNEIRQHPFVFLINGEKIEKKYDLTDQGSIGIYDEDNWINKISYSKKKQDEFMALFVKSEAIFVDGFEYHIDDLSQIPCLKEN